MIGAGGASSNGSRKRRQNSFAWAVPASQRHPRPPPPAKNHFILGPAAARNCRVPDLDLSKTARPSQQAPPAPRLQSLRITVPRFPAAVWLHPARRPRQAASAVSLNTKTLPAISAFGPAPWLRRFIKQAPPLFPTCEAEPFASCPRPSGALAPPSVLKSLEKSAARQHRTPPRCDQPRCRASFRHVSAVGPPIGIRPSSRKFVDVVSQTPLASPRKPLVRNRPRSAGGPVDPPRTSAL